MLLDCLLAIAERVLNSEKQYSLITEVPMATDFADVLLHTMFTILMRSLSKNPEVWKRFQKTLSKATRWEQTILRWAVKLWMRHFLYLSFSPEHLDVEHPQ